MKFTEICFKTSITQAIHPWQLVLLILFCACGSVTNVCGSTQREQFKNAWSAATKGDHATFNKIAKTLQSYALYPYLQYEDYRNRRVNVPAQEMSAFLETYQDWAFAPGLRMAWLNSLAKKGRWADLVAYSGGVNDTVLRCQRARGQIALKQFTGLLLEAQTLWMAGKSQPGECDPVFAWLIKNNGIAESLAWQRIRLAIEANNRALTIYLQRFVPKKHRIWLREWQTLNRAGYSRLEHTRHWPDNEITRMITVASIRGLIHKDVRLAVKKFHLLDGHFNWEQTQRARLLRDIALYSAVGLEADTDSLMRKVPVSFWDSQLLEWWARFLLSRKQWPELIFVIEQMPEEIRADDRWRYWSAQAGLRSGRVNSPSGELRKLADNANYYGFLAADELGLEYNICPLEPDVKLTEIDRIAGIDGFQRALELRKAGLTDWANNEWSLAAARLAPGELRAVAALAQRENWYDRVIFALGNSGDIQFYKWRFPLLWESEIKRQAANYKVDPAWVYGTIRSESAMSVTAQSSANALGLMQVTPATGRRVAKKHGLRWNGSTQLKTVDGNLPIGTAYMSDLLQEFGQNPVLVSGSYNAGPKVVSRWLDKRPMGEAAIWIETLPYFETRDYIPRVLAFTTLYAWRLGGVVKRISVRMPDIESGKIAVGGSTRVVCRSQTDELVLRN